MQHSDTLYEILAVLDCGFLSREIPLFLDVCSSDLISYESMEKHCVEWCLAHLLIA